MGRQEKYYAMEFGDRYGGLNLRTIFAKDKKEAIRRTKEFRDWRLKSVRVWDKGIGHWRRLKTR